MRSAETRLAAREAELAAMRLELALAELVEAELATVKLQAGAVWACDCDACEGEGWIMSAPV